MSITRNNAGFTLLGLVVALTLGLVIIAAGLSVFSSHQKGYNRLQSSTVVLQDVRMVNDQFAREIRMAGFGVDAGQAIIEASDNKLTFWADVADDVRLPLAQNASAGATQILVDLNDDEPGIDDDDRIFLDGPRRESIPVKSSGKWLDVDVEPDIIYLDHPLAYDHTAAGTTVQTVERLEYQFNPKSHFLSRNAEIVSDDVQSLVFGYYDQYGNSLAPAPGESLTNYQMSLIQSFEAQITLADPVNGLVKLAQKTFSTSVDLRNHGFLHYRNDHCPPKNPIGVQVTNDSTCNHFQVRWTPPTKNACDNSNIDDLGGYLIYYGTQSGQYLRPPYAVPDPDSYEAWVRDLRLENGQTYYVAVVAYDTSYNESSKSPETNFVLLDTTGPEPPTEATTVTGPTSVALTWAKSTDRDVVGYRLYRKTGEEANELVVNEETLKEDATTYTDSGLVNCTKYSYFLAAVDCQQEGELTEEITGDGSGEEVDTPDSGITDTTTDEETPAPPGPVSPFTANPGSSLIELDWVSPQDADLEGVIIRYNTGGYPSSPTSGTELLDVKATPGSVGEYDHSEVINGLTYYYSAFAYDKCGNFSDAAQVSATPGQDGPEVRLIAPLPGATITDGKLVLQAQAYDPDEATVGTPPSFTSDNGKGITEVKFFASPDPLSQFPNTDYSLEYCGFGGDNNPCDGGDVSKWCEDEYYFYAKATDNESASASSDFHRVYLQNGGLKLYPDFTPVAVGSYQNEVRYKVYNDSSDHVVDLKKVTFGWDIPEARIIMFGPSDDPGLYDRTLENKLPYPSGTQFSLPSWMKLYPDEDYEMRIRFAHWFSRLAQDRSEGNTVFSLTSIEGFAVGDTIYFDNRAREPRTIVDINGKKIKINKALPWYAEKYWSVAKVPDYDNMNMSGVTLTSKYEYKLANQSYCDLEFDLTLEGYPYLDKVFQDKPQVDTVPMIHVGQIVVKNDDDVLVHVKVADWSGSGISEVKLHYTDDDAGLSAAPTSGYSTLAMSWNRTKERYQATIPGDSDTRIWYYIEAVNGEDSKTRLPISEAYTYDCLDYDPPSCPTNLTATKKSSNKVDLEWVGGDDIHVIGYNVYRKKNCDAFSKIASNVTDQQVTIAKIQYRDQNSDLNLNKYCYTYYVTAVDVLGNESIDCETNTADAGKNCPPSCGGGDDDDDDDDDNVDAQLYIPDESSNKVFKYTSGGNLVGSFDLSSANGNPRGMAKFGSYVYVLDQDDKKVYRYPENGGKPTESRYLTRKGNGGNLSEPDGLAIIDNFLWLVDDGGKRINRYSLSAVFSGGSELKASQEIDFSGSNTDGEGLGIDAKYLYVLDDEDKRIYRYAQSGEDSKSQRGESFRGGRIPVSPYGMESSQSKVLKRQGGGSLGKPSGLMIDGQNVWVCDKDKDKAFKYSLSALFSGSGDLNAQFEFDLNSSNHNPQGM